MADKCCVTHTHTIVTQDKHRKAMEEVGKVHTARLAQLQQQMTAARQALATWRERHEQRQIASAAMVHSTNCLCMRRSIDCASHSVMLLCCCAVL